MGTQPGRTGGYDPVRTRQALTSSAIELFRLHGYDATSVQQVADAAGVTKGAFYHHFASKQDLLLLIHDEYVDHQLAECQRVLSSYAGASKQLYHLIQTILLSVAEYRGNVTVFFQERRYLSGEHFAAVKAKRDELDAVFQRVVEQGIAEGSLRGDLHARSVTLGIIGMCAWTYQWFQDDGPLTADEIADTFARMVLEGLEA